MSEYSVVSDAALTATADAIRAKTGSQSTITWNGTTGFANAVGTIPSGYSLDDFATSNISGNVVLTTTGNIVPYAFYGFTGITGLTANSVNGIGTNAFRGMTGLTYLAANSAISLIGADQIRGCTNLVTLSLGKLGTLQGSDDIRDCTSLTTVDFGTVSSILSRTFYGDSALNALVLRRTSITALNNVNAFDGTPFASGGAGGTIYIPKTLYDHLGDGTDYDYKAATNWSTIDGYGTITWAKIEGSQYENYYADGTPISTT